MGQRFIPTETFEATVNGRPNRYLAGEQYTVHDTPQHADLAKKVQGWQEQGRVQIVGHTRGRSVPGGIKTGDS